MIRIRKFNLDEKIYDPELGDGISSTEYIFEHYYKSGHPEDYFISFTAIDKLGINPQSKYSTPLGIYTYPVEQFFDQYVGYVNETTLDPQDKKKKIGEFAPFAGNNPWVWVMEIDRSKGKVFDISEYSERDYEEDIYNLIDLRRDYLYNLFSEAIGREIVERLKEKLYNKNIISEDEYNDVISYEEILNFKDDLYRYEQYINLKEFDDILFERIDSIGEEASYHSIPAGRMWNITRIVAKKDPVQWNKLFREMGYICAIDREGEGVIHESERVQAVFFQRKYFNVVDKIENVKASKTIDDVPIFNDEFKEKIEYKIDKIFKVYPNDKEMITKQLLFILKEVAQKPITPEQAKKAANNFYAIYLKVSNKYDFFSFEELNDMLLEILPKISSAKFFEAMINVLKE